MEERVILVDENDTEIGSEEKMEAHRGGKLHRAFSIFIFNSNEDMLLQRRARDKYHSGGLWSNACCSHPRVGEFLKEAAHRRLNEEMGFDCDLNEAFSFIYRAEIGDLIEHELDHVFIGTYDGEADPNPHEVEDYKWAVLEPLKEDMRNHPENYTEWFKIAFERVINFCKKDC